MKLKDKKIMIYRQGVVGRDPANQPIVGFTPIHPGKLWAYFRQLSAREFFAGKMVQYEETALFRINHRDDLQPTFLILFNDEWFDIGRVDIFEGGKNDITIYVKTAKTAPKPENVFPYNNEED